MIFALLAFSLVCEPYEFEIDPGLAFEVTSGVHLNDRVDSNAYPLGGRLTYLNTSETDAFLAPEISFFNEIVPSNSPGPKRRYTYQLGLNLYETYNPFAFRAGLGGGAEYRNDDWASLASARAGLGYFFNADIAAWIDISQRWIFRSPWSYPLTLEAGLQIVF